MKTNSYFIVKDIQHFNNLDTVTLKLLLKPSGGISADALGLHIDTNINRTKFTDKFVVNATTMTNGYIDLSQLPHSNEHMFVIFNGMILDDGAGNDFQLAIQRITFEAGFPLSVNDKIIVKYKY